jgi:hypothetical protein
MSVPVVSPQVLTLTRARSQWEKAASTYMIDLLSTKRIWDILVEEHAKKIAQSGKVAIQNFFGVA